MPSQAVSQGGASCLVLANNNPLRRGGHLGLYNGSFRRNSYKCNLRGNAEHLFKLSQWRIHSIIFIEWEEEERHKILGQLHVSA